MGDSLRNFSTLQCVMFGIILWAIWRLLRFSYKEMHLFVDANSTYRRERQDRHPNDRYSPGNEIVTLNSVLTELERFVSRVVSTPLIKKNCWRGGGTVDTATTLWAGPSGNFVLIFGRGRGFLFSQNDPDRPWGLLRLQISGYQWIFPHG
jgi:hypothetical protein